MSAEQDPEVLAERLEGVICSADMALTEEEIDYIGDAIGFLRAESRRRDGIREKLDQASRGDSA